MHNISSFLISIGLSETETGVYKFLLENGKSTVTEVQTELSLLRSTTYHAIHTLQEKGLIIAKKTGGILQLKVAGKDSVESYLDSKTKALEEQKMTLNNIQSLFPDESETDNAHQVTTVDTVAGMKKIIDTALACKSREWRIIAPRTNFLYEYDASYADYFKQKRKIHKIRSRTIWERDAKKPSAPSVTLGEYTMRNPRYLPKNYTGTFNSLIILFDDSIAYISSLQQHHAILVTSKDISSTMAVLFDALWEKSDDLLTL